MSNVKAGDLAVIVRDHPQCDANIGRFVRVIGGFRFSSHEGMHVWDVESVGAPLVVVSEADGHVYKDTRDIFHPDAWLRPLRDPGDDATDEMTRIAGKPTEEQDRLWAEFDTAMSELEKRLAERSEA